MNKVIAILTVTLLLLFGFDNTAEAGRRCIGSSHCSACTNCSGCKYCNEGGGTCGICSRGNLNTEYNTPSSSTSQPQENSSSTSTTDDYKPYNSSNSSSSATSTRDYSSSNDKGSSPGFWIALLFIGWFVIKLACKNSGKK